MGWILVLGILGAWGAEPGALEESFSLTDLEKLQGKGRWAEVVLKAKLVPVADHGPTWRGVVARSAERYLRQLHGEGTLDGLEMAIALPNQFPFLFTEKEFLNARHEVGVEGLASCYQNPFAEDLCTDRALELVKKEKSDTVFTDQVLNVLDKADQNQGAVTLVGALLNPSTAPKLCPRLDFKKGLRELWGSTDFEKQFTATQLARGDCFPILKGWLEEVAKGNGPASPQVCKLFQQRAERIPACTTSESKNQPE